MNKTSGGWIWYELITPDFSGARAFYEAVIGWRLQPGGPETNNYGFIVSSDGAMTGGVLTLTKEMADHGARPSWVGYIHVEDCDKAVAAAISMGGACLMPPRDIPMAGRIAMLADCCGAPYYVMTPAPQPGGGDSSSFTRKGKLGRCSWNELQADKPAKAIDYYATLYGWELPEPMDMGAHGKYQFIARGGETIGAIMGKMAPVPFSFWTFYFRVGSIAAAKDRVTGAGGAVVMGPMEVPGGEWVIVGVDPQGASFALVGEK